MKWLPIAVAIPSLMHYILFGMLEPLGVPAFFKSLGRSTGLTGTISRCRTKI